MNGSTRDVAEPPAPRACTVRAVLLGLSLAGVTAWLTPINDWLLRNTPLYNNANPCLVTALAMILVGVVNPLLGRRRLAAGELVVVLALVLAVGGVVSGGLLRRQTAVVAGAAHVAARDIGLQPLAMRRDDGPASWPLPPGLFLGVAPDGRVDATDPEHAATVERYFTGGDRPRPIIEHRAQVRWQDADGEHSALAWEPNTLEPAPPGSLDLAQRPSWRGLTAGSSADGVTILGVESPAIAWSVWWRRLAAWTPLIVGGLAALLGLAGLVRRQWIVHERLPFPVATITATLIDDPEPGRRLPAVLRQRVFWWGFIITAVLLLWKGLSALGWVPIGLSTRIELWQLFQGSPWSDVYTWWFTFNLQVWFSVIALSLLIPPHLSFSIWAGFWGLNLLYLVLRQAGIPIQAQHASDATIGGFIAWAGLILWLGRGWYLAALRAAFKRCTDPALADAARHVRLLLAGCAVMLIFLVWWGAPVVPAAISIVLFLGIFLVLARLVAEAGIPFVSLPGSFNRIMWVCFGGSAPPAGLIMLAAIGYTLLADSREGLLPYATQAQYLGERHRVRSWPLTLWMGVALAIALVIGVVSMLLIADHHHGHPDTFWQPPFVEGVMRPLANGVATGEGPGVNGTALVSGAVGGVLVGIIGALRMLWPGFVFHPIGFLVCTTYATSVLVFSVFLGWLAKALIMRYGGLRLYRQMIPAAIGVVAAEAVMTLLFVVIVALARAGGLALAGEPVFMPR